MKRFGALLVVLLIAAGCVRTSSHESLTQRLLATRNNSFYSDLFYIGSTEKYDYFVERNPLGAQTHRVAIGQIAIGNRMKRTQDERLWRRCEVLGMWDTNAPARISVPAGSTPTTAVPPRPQPSSLFNSPDGTN
jgi:hypothetical protein